MNSVAVLDGVEDGETAEVLKRVAGKAVLSGAEGHAGAAVVQMDVHLCAALRVVRAGRSAVERLTHLWSRTFVVQKGTRHLKLGSSFFLDQPGSSARLRTRYM